MQRSKLGTDRDFLRRQITIISAGAEMILGELIGLEFGVQVHFGERGEKPASLLKKNQDRLNEIKAATREITTALGR